MSSQIVIRNNYTVRPQIIDQSKMFDLSAPYSEEAEEAVIGSVLINPDAFSSVALIVEANDFYLIRHGYIWIALTALNRRGVPFDYLTLMQELKEMGWLDDVGGPGYITRLINNTPTSMNAEFYAQIVFRTALRRRAMYHAESIKGWAVDESINVDEFIELVSEQWRKVIARHKLKHLPTAEDVANRDLDRLEKHNFAEPIYGITSGFNAFDHLTGGFLPYFYVGVARTSHGKSVWSRQVAVNAARQGARIAYFTLEESTEAALRAMVAAETGLLPINIEKGMLSQLELKRYMQGLGRIAKLPITFIDDSIAEDGLVTPSVIRSCCETIRDQRGLDMVIVDYGQAVEAENPLMRGNIYQQNTATALALFKLSRDLKIPVICMTQANREANNARSKLDLMPFIEGSGKYGQKADFVFSIWHEFKDDPACLDPNMIRIKVNKNKITGFYGETFNQLHPSTKLTEYLRQNAGGEPHYFASSMDALSDET